MARNIGATISLKDGNFTSGIKKAITGVQNLKTHTTNATGTLKKMSSQNKLTGDSLGSLAKKVTGVVAAYAGFSKAVDFTKQCISACDTQVKAEARLEQLMMNVKGTTLEKNSGSDSVAVVNFKRLDGKNHIQSTSLCAIKVSCIFLESLVKYSFQPQTRICRVGYFSG